jgi:hypothetical protein
MGIFHRETMMNSFILAPMRESGEPIPAPFIVMRPLDSRFRGNDNKGIEQRADLISSRYRQQGCGFGPGSR